MRQMMTHDLPHLRFMTITTNMAFMNDKEVEYLINLYQSERSLWDSNDKCYYDANKRLQGLDRIRIALDNKYSQGKLTVQRTDCCHASP